MDKILITGGAGFVGRHFVRRLLNLGNEIHCVDRIAPLTGGIHPREGWNLDLETLNYSPFDYNNFHFFEEDCRTYFGRVKDTDFDYVLHLAAMVGGRLMIEQQPLIVADDLSIDANYWQWAVQCSPAKTIFFSSSAAYPVKYQTYEDYILLKEDMIDFKYDVGMPDMTYGWAKLTGEYISRLAFERHGLKSVVYRPFSGYGEDQDDTYPFPSICKRAIDNKGKPELYVWGTGDQMRDFIHIEDCVDGVLMTMDKIEDGDAINLSTGIFTSFRQFAGYSAAACGYSVNVKGLSDKPSGVFARGGDITKQKQLGFSHKISFKEGINRAIKFYTR